MHPSPSLSQSESQPLRFSDLSSEELEVEKIAARQKLLSMPPEEAQALVNQVLHPHLWELDPDRESWKESIETHYGDTDYCSPLKVLCFTVLCVFSSFSDFVVAPTSFGVRLRAEPLLSALRLHMLSVQFSLTFVLLCRGRSPL